LYKLANELLLEFITHKTKVRPGTRFFGEAYVATIMSKEMKHGWYSSYKWLTNDKWLTGKNLKNQFKISFYKALKKHIGINKLKKIQHHSKIYHKKKKIMPQAPDIWFIDKNGKYRFIEVKKGNDKIHDGQIEGLAIIKRYLKGDVAIMNLYPEGSKVPKQIDHTQKFLKIYNSLPR